MCGIIGITRNRSASVKSSLISALERLEYRGYDSCGFATSAGKIEKSTGKINSFRFPNIQFKTAISHTRWATHGGVTTTNSHPHFNNDKTIFVVHNGIIENFIEMRSRLETQGCNFISDTDSEIIPHYLDCKLSQGKTMPQAIRDFFNEAQGTFAALIIRKDQNKIYALKKDSPLVLGLCKNSFTIASDIYAFSNRTNKAIFFDDYEYAVIEPDSYTFYNREGAQIQKPVTEFQWSREEQTKESYPHYMIKEIREQPETSQRLIQSINTTQKDKIQQLASLIKQSKRIVFVACGTSYHASLVGAQLMQRYPVHAIIASEFDTFYHVNPETLVIAISQSGETMDVVRVVKEAKARGASAASLTNVPYSTLQRISDISLEILAGQEICVAATKSFTNQVILLLALAKELGIELDLEQIPLNIAHTIEKNEPIAKETASKLKDRNDIFILGKGPSYPVSREIALKLKEIPYMHAEGMMAGELKHGTIALIEQDTPVISLIPNNNKDMISSTKEVEARGAKTIIISNTNGDFHLPASKDADFAIYASIIGHLLSYYIAVLRGCEIDKPRNLAKSVTVN